MEGWLSILTIRPLESRDVEAILAIQAACPEIAQWTAWDYDRVAHGEMAGWVAIEKSNVGTEIGAGVADEVAPEFADEVAGFLVARRLSSDLEILNFAVESEWRRCGTGAKLLGAALQWAQAFQATHAILEVRASNLGALRFYERHKFEVVGRRPDYYTAPVEDALLLTAPLT
jgi:ribosomal protein S18 acetylase RimI-like enzyme